MWGTHFNEVKIIQIMINFLVRLFSRKINLYKFPASSTLALSKQRCNSREVLQSWDWPSNQKKLYKSTHTIQVWYIHIDVGKCTIHGSYGVRESPELSHIAIEWNSFVSGFLSCLNPLPLSDLVTASQVHWRTNCIHPIRPHHQCCRAIGFFIENAVFDGVCYIPFLWWLPFRISFPLSVARKNIQPLFFWAPGGGVIGPRQFFI